MPKGLTTPAFRPTFRPVSPEGAVRLLMDRLAVPKAMAQAIADELGAGAWQLAWTVATVTDLAVMEGIRSSLEAIIEGGGTMRDWLSMLDDMGWRSPLGTWHEETIFRTMLGQVMEGERYEALIGDENVEWLVFDAVDDDRVDEECLSLDGTAFRREEFPDALWPPIHFNCRCSVIPADESDLEGLGASPHSGPPPLDHVQKGFDSPPSVEGLTETLRATAADALREGGWGVHAPSVPGR